MAITKDDILERIASGEDWYTEFKAENIDHASLEAANQSCIRHGICVARNPVLFSHANRLRVSIGVGQGLHALFQAHPTTQLMNDSVNRIVRVSIPRHSA